LKEVFSVKKQSDLSQLMGYAGNYRYFTYASWVLSAVSALVALVPFVYIWKILRDVLNAAPDYAQAVNIPHYGWMAVLFAVLAYLIYIAALMCSHLSAFRVATNLRLEVSEHLATLPLGFTETFGSGKLRKIIHESTGAAETFLAHQLPDKYNAMATPIGLLVLLLVFDWRLGLLSLVPVALGFVIMSAMTGRRMADKMRQYGNALESMSNEAVEYVRGIPVVKTFGQSVFSFKKFKATIDEYEKWVIAYTKELRMPMMLYTAAINGVFAFLIVGGLLFTRNGVTSEFLLNLLFYIIITPVISLTLTRIMYMSENELVVADALARVDSVLDAEPVPENDHPRHPKDASVSLKDVHFSYDGKTDVIKGVSLKIQPGQMVAFVGPSGGGKSTLANLICRFFDVQSGSVRVGGADVRDIPKEELMDTISFVFQNSRLLKGSILDNVRLGRAQATEAEVLAALKAAQCMDIVEKFPEGIHTVIGTKGVYLSGGEQQRIAIARAMLKNAPILLLDEATAFADPDNEAKVQAAFAQLAKGKTVLMIAHRLSTVANADCIYVVQDGQIVESGTKDELCAQNGLFARMWQDYQASVQWKVAKEG
jgi:ATP-binding cassette subfamily B protein IrtA